MNVFIKKLLIVFTVVLMVGVATTNASMNASIFTITPDISQEEQASIGDFVTFDLDLQVGTGFSTNSWDLVFEYDDAELDLVEDSISYGLDFEEFNLTNGTPGDMRLFAGTLSDDVVLSDGTEYFIASFTFEVIGLNDDGITDFELFDQIDDKGFWASTDFENPVAQFSGAQGADVSPVPVPAAAWLLGSGLIGLAGLRRRNRK
jgi:hypothetical protein